LTCRYPADPARDTVAVSGNGCDAVVFLVFNEFAKDCKTPVYGHKYGGSSQVSTMKVRENSFSIFKKIYMFLLQYFKSEY
jgi:hypothetical protein